MSARSPGAPLYRPAPTGNEHRLMCYLLFSGSQQTPRGGLGDLAGSFTSEASAREAFRHLRLSQASASSWAQLAVVDGHHGIRTLCWFGIKATPARTPVTASRPEKSIHTQTEGGVMQIATRESSSTAGPEVEPTAQWHLVRRIVACLVGVVAVTAMAIGVVSDDGRPRSVTPNPASVGADDPTNSPVVPFSVVGSAVGDGISSVDG